MLHLYTADRTNITLLFHRRISELARNLQESSRLYKKTLDISKKLENVLDSKMSFVFLVCIIRFICRVVSYPDLVQKTITANISSVWFSFELYFVSIFPPKFINKHISVSAEEKVAIIPRILFLPLQSWVKSTKPTVGPPPRSAPPVKKALLIFF